MQEKSLLFFLLTVAGISLSGVMMPGPVFAATLARSTNSRFAGSFIAIGHGIVEFPLMVLIYFGLYHLFQTRSVKIALGIIGGVVLIYLGKDIFNLKKAVKVNFKKNNPGSKATLTGALTSLFNPYFILWWITVGTVLIMRSTVFGVAGFVLFGIVHWLCDFLWYSFVSLGAHHSGKMWGEKVQIFLYGISSLLLIFFGTWFVISSIKWMI
ncbi:LysE family transporter [Candidatus Aerophobetes bacterium]|nr:LysE family transporter [Candidatus Aerophobetes bacterium]